MSNKSSIKWTLREITQLLRKRQLNQYDANFAVSGNRGDGKSTFAFKIFNSFKKESFNQNKHQVYAQTDVINLLAKQKFKYCWDDEAINSGYKRDFQHQGQKKLIKIVTNYRDNFNIYGSALPFFTSLDKDLRALIFMHFHIIERGLAVMFMPLESNIFGDDKWDIKRNIKIEDQENKRVQRSPGLKFRYHRFSTFAGYIYFGDMTPQQRRRYEEIKQTKRAKNFGMEEEPLTEDTFNERMYKALIAGKLSKDFLQQTCLIEGKKYSSALSILNTMLKDNGMQKTVSELWIQKDKKKLLSKSNGDINDLVPDF